MRAMVLGTAAVALGVLVACNGGLVWLYQHSSAGVVATVGTFIAAAALAWLRNRGRQFTAIVLAVQALVAVSVVAGVLVALKAGVFTGIFAAGITLAGLVVLSLVGLVYYTGERTRAATMLSLGAAIAVVISMIGAYGFLSWDYQNSVYNTPYVEPAPDAVYWLVEDGQTYTGDPAEDDSKATKAFKDYTCPDSRAEIKQLFTDLVEPGERKLSSPENLKLTDEGQQGNTMTATVTAQIKLLDLTDIDIKVIKGPETWTFYLEKRPGDAYWQVCRIDRPT